ncbi:MAG: Uma2 family endonuclease [Taibaiella sp.]|nr:Uma2 family endonuclease [Taibaiella sp.]
MTLANLDTGKLYSYADYLKWQIEERVELLKGKIFAMSPAPSTNHQIISGCVFYLLMNELKGKPCMVFSAPFDVRIGTGTDNDIFTVVQPDICVIRDRSKIDEKGCMGAPDIVLEILSPANNGKDLKNKYKIYEEAGVREYWVVSPQDHTFVVNTLQAGKFVASKTMVEGEVVYSAVLVGFSIDLSALFEQLL